MSEQIPLDLLEAFAAGREVPDRVRAQIASSPELLARVAELREDNSLIEELISATSETTPLAPEGYRLIAELGRGAQGVVYRAEQLQTRREVAVKLLAPSRRSARRAVRFEREIELVASLRHPNIVTVHGGGVTPAGWRFLVMEYVKGEPLDDWTTRAPSTLDTVLRLFLQICRGVAHAHQRGVIHRDLKPSNILVDGEGVARIVDFGLARAVDGGSDLTHSGDVVGTLAYASPEQAAGRQQDIDTRTDVYALGGVLYFLLTGLSPHDSDAGLADTLRTIESNSPPPPSGVRGMGDSELDTLVLCALSKERDRRYSSAWEFARDVERYLAHEPIEARRASTWYVACKLARRHRVALGAAIGTMLVVSGASVVFAAQAIALRRERNAARIAEGLAKSAAHDAESEAARARTMVDVFSGMIGRALPDVARGREVTVAEVLGAVPREFAKEFEGEPGLEALVRRSLGESYRTLGDLDAAESHLVRAVELLESLPAEAGEAREARRIADLAEVHEDLASTLMRRSRIGEAETHFRRSLELSTGNALARTTRATALVNFAALLAFTSRATDAEAALNEALGLIDERDGPDSERALNARNNLVRVLRVKGSLEESEALGRRTSAAWAKLSGVDHPGVLAARCNLAETLVERGANAEAAEIYESCAEIGARVYGVGHPTVLVWRSNLGTALLGAGNTERAVATLEEVQKELDSAPAPDAGAVIANLGNLGGAYARAGRSDAAVAAITRALTMSRQTFGADHPWTAELERRLHTATPPK